MNSKSELFDPRLAAVIELARRSWPKAASANGEDQRPKGLRVFVIERTIDENVVDRSRGPCGQSSVEREGLERAHDTSHIVQGNRGALGHRLEYTSAGDRAGPQRQGTLGLAPAGNGLLFRVRFT